MKTTSTLVYRMLVLSLTLILISCNSDEGGNESPISEVIFFTSYEDGFSEIHELRTASGTIINHSNANFQPLSPGEYFFPDGDYQPDISPNGEQIIFSSSKRPEGELFRKPISGSIAALLLPTNSSKLTWSFDGTALGFLNGSQTSKSIYVLQPGQPPAQAQQVTNPPAGVSDDGFCFAPTPGVILFSRKLSENNHDLYAVNINLPGVEPLVIKNTPDLNEQDPKVSADGNFMAYHETGFSNGQTTRKLKVFPYGDLNTIILEFDFSAHPVVGPNYGGYDFTSQGDGLIISLEKKVNDTFGDNSNMELFHLHLESGELTQLTDNDYPDTQPSIKARNFSEIDWFTDRGNIPHHASDNSEVQLPLLKRWEIDLDTEPTGKMYASVVGAYGRLFVGMDSIMYCLNPIDGSELWNYKAQGWIINPAAAIQLDKIGNERVFFNTNAKHIYALNGSTGVLEWENEYPSVAGGGVTAPIEIISGRLFYMDKNDQNKSLIRVLNMSNGEEIWTEDVGDIFLSSLVHGYGSLFSRGNNSDNLYGYYVRLTDDTGELEWAFDEPYPEHQDGQGTFGGSRYSSGVFYSDVADQEQPLLIIGHGRLPARVVAVNVASGTSKWKSMLSNDGWITGFAATQDRPSNALICSTLNTIYKLNPGTGAIDWEYNFSPSNNPLYNEVPRPSIWGDYVFQVVNGNSTLVALNLADGSVAWEYDFGEISYASPAIGSESLYITTESGKVLAFSPE